MTRHPSHIDVTAPIHWVPREEYTTYFDSLSPNDRWSNSQYANQAMIWHWEERRWWALQEET
jgi:hypothetical protein